MKCHNFSCTLVCMHHMSDRWSCLPACFLLSIPVFASDTQPLPWIQCYLSFGDVLIMHLYSLMFNFACLVEIFRIFRIYIHIYAHIHTHMFFWRLVFVFFFHLRQGLTMSCSLAVDSRILGKACITVPSIRPVLCVGEQCVRALSLLSLPLPSSLPPSPLLACGCQRIAYTAQISPASSCRVDSRDSAQVVSPVAGAFIHWTCSSFPTFPNSS